MTKKARRPIDAELAKLMERAARRPGVAEVLKLHERYQQQLAQIQDQVGRRRGVVWTASDSTA